MADKKSREVVAVERNDDGEEWGLYAETADGKRYAISEAECRRLEDEIKKRPNPELDFTQVLYEAYSDGSPIIDKDETSGRSIEIEVNIDVSEALTGLKAVQREAKEATKALRELEAQIKINSALPSGGLRPSLRTSEQDGEIKIDIKRDYRRVEYGEKE